MSEAAGKRTEHRTPQRIAEDRARNLQHAIAGALDLLKSGRVSGARMLLEIAMVNSSPAGGERT
jgi:hypothetical protein